MEGTSSNGIAARMTDGVKIYGMGDAEVHALDGVTQQFAAGQFSAIMGPSGSGKSTMLHTLAGLDNLTSGTVHIGDTELGTLSDRDLTILRRKKVGFVFQAFNLIPRTSALENVELPLIYGGVSFSEQRRRAILALERVGLAERADHHPSQLSGGEQQRVAIARALLNDPAIVLADEPTGNLDPHTAEVVFDLLIELVREAGLAVLIATHNLDLAARMDRTLHLEDGHVS